MFFLTTMQAAMDPTEMGATASPAPAEITQYIPPEIEARIAEDCYSYNGFLALCGPEQAENLDLIQLKSIAAKNVGRITGRYGCGAKFTFYVEGSLIPDFRDQLYRLINEGTPPQCNLLKNIKAALICAPSTCIENPYGFTSEFIAQNNMYNGVKFAGPMVLVSPEFLQAFPAGTIIDTGLQLLHLTPSS